jgi:hypothetical protein
MAHIADTASWWSTVLPFLALLSAAYVYIMKNNVDHVRRENDRVIALAEVEARLVADGERNALAALAAHVQRQNRIALIALIPLGFFVVLNELPGFDRGSLRAIATVASPVLPNSHRSG